MFRPIFLVLAAASLVCGAGCTGVQESRYVTPERLDAGLVLILPGIEGESPFNRDVQRGLDEAGLPYALAIYRWGRPIPIAGPLINQMDVVGNRLEARRIAHYIEAYRLERPGEAERLAMSGTGDK